MTINFKLKPVREVARDQDDMGRCWVGFAPTINAPELYEQNRGIWQLGPRVAQEPLATFSHDGTVRAVVELAGVETVPAKAPGPCHGLVKSQDCTTQAVSSCAPARR